MTISPPIIASIVAAIATVFAAGVAAFLGAWLAPRRYRSERWFDRKMETYASIFDAMNEMLEELDQLLEEETRPNFFITSEHRTTLVEASAKARQQLRKASRIGAFVITDKAERKLADLLVELDNMKAESYFDHIDTSAAAISHALSELKIEARCDLI